jgi:uncharacterized protein YecT (DUF1311 family)
MLNSGSPSTLSLTEKYHGMERFIRIIDKQIAYNRGKNIFLEELDIFQFIDEMVLAWNDIQELNKESEKFLVDYATNKSLEEFCRMNQYYSFDTECRQELNIIYSDLFSEIRQKPGQALEISKSHYQKLRAWLKKHNVFAEKMYSKSGESVEPVACSEYNPELQIDILHIDVSRLISPILDIGCGKHGQLVNYLVKHGKKAFGIDRFSYSSDILQKADWLEYDYGIKKWGTIISNLGFSNHFKHHHLREDGNYLEYGKTFMSILNSLKVGGSFHYAPDLPFIEEYLDARQYQQKKFNVPG